MGFLRKAAARFLKGLTGGSTVIMRGAHSIWQRVFGKPSYDAAYWLKKFNESSILQRPIRRLMEDFADVEFCLKRKRRGANGRIVLEDVFDHPAMRLLERPNPRMTGQQFKELWEHYKTVTGRFLVYVVFGENGLPEALWPIATNKIRETPDPSRGRLNWKFEGPNGKDLTVGPEHVMFDPLINGAEPYGLGVGLCTPVTKEIEMDDAASDWSVNFFKNGSHPGAIVNIPDLEEGEEKKLQEHWDKNHTGLKNAHKTLFISTQGDDKASPVSVHKMGSGHRDMDFNNGRQAIKDRVRENFNVPAELVGDTKNANRAASLASENFHQKANIKPRAKRAAAFLNAYYLPLWDEPDLVMTFLDPVKEDRMLLHKALLDGVKNGCATRDEWREARGMDPMETDITGGLSIPLNMMIIREDGTIIMAPREETHQPEPDGDQAELDKSVSDILRKVALSLEALSDQRAA